MTTSLVCIEAGGHEDELGRTVNTARVPVLQKIGLMACLDQAPGYSNCGTRLGDEQRFLVEAEEKDRPKTQTGQMFTQRVSQRTETREQSQKHHTSNKAS